MLRKEPFENDCVWFDKTRCKVLKTLSCSKDHKCSFYETEEAFHKRQTDFNERHGITEDMRIL